MHACYETEKILYLVLELLTGGELFDCIIAKVRARDTPARVRSAATLSGSLMGLHRRVTTQRPTRAR